MELIFQIFFTTLAVAFGVLHLMLYFHNRKNNSNLYFALFLLLYAANIFFDYQSSMSSNETQIFYLRWHRAVMPYNPIFALLFIYSLFKIPIPRQFWIISLGLVVTGALAVYDPVNNFNYVQIFLLAVSLEAIRLMIMGLREKIEGARLIAVGYLLMFVFSSYDMFLDLGLMEPIYDINNGYPFGFLCLIVLMSVYLARDFARTNERILQKERETKELEVQQRLLEAEDLRKTKELDEARQLQLSMLPECIGQINNLDICFEMKTATEVGGDYYDYHLSDDGTLTLAIGDATGHGMKAGIMVSIVKSLFITQVAQTDIPGFFSTVSRAIKEMRLGNLYMALMIIKVKNGRLTISSAGMPPLYIHRIKTGTVEEHIIKGMPLGAFDYFDYRVVETQLSPGDTVLVMSDGLAESFDDGKEIFDYGRVKQVFGKVATSAPDEIVRQLIEAGNAWRNGKKQEDDITLAVFKMSE